MSINASLNSRLNLQSEILFNHVKHKTPCTKHRLYDAILRFEKLKISIIELETTLEEVEHDLFYFYAFLTIKQAPVEKQHFWNQHYDTLLTSSVFRNGLSWSKVSQDIFRSADYASSCRLRWETISKSTTISTSDSEIIEECISSFLSVRKGNYKTIAKKIHDKFTNFYIDAVEVLLCRNICYAFIAARVTQELRVR